jgi:hypothetical protein
MMSKHMIACTMGAIGAFVIGISLKGDIMSFATGMIGIILLGIGGILEGSNC